MDPLKFCPGSNRPCETQTWYYPSDSSPDRLTYCQFCVNRGCVDGTTLLTTKSNIANCDCPHQNRHKSDIWEVIPFVCESCQDVLIKVDDLNKTCVVCSRKVEAGLNCCNYCSSGNGRCLICGLNAQKEDPSNSELFNNFPMLKAVVRIRPNYGHTAEGRYLFTHKRTDGSYLTLYSCSETHSSSDSDSEEEETTLWTKITKIFPGFV